jgi:class 3 adenylate cyclase
MRRRSYEQLRRRRGFFVASIGTATACSRWSRALARVRVGTETPLRMDVPETRYARSGDISIAYQVMGEGPFDLVLIPGSSSHVEFGWQVPGGRLMRERLASFSRLLFFDKRGTGMSDRAAGIADLETRMDDVRAVMDAAGSERAAVFGLSEGAPLGILFAATYPDRCWALVLYGGMARQLRAPDYPWGPTEAEYRQWIAEEQAFSWEPEAIAEDIRKSAPPHVPEEEIHAAATEARYASSPQASVDLMRMNMEIDVRRVLSAIRVPTLVLHRPLDDIPIEHGRYIAGRISGAKFVELPGTGHGIWAAEVPSVTDEIERFVRRAWEAGAAVEHDPDRVLATVMFTDIVGASEQAATLGDSAWRTMLERHHELVRRQLLRHRGVEVDTAGDGFFASFDGPARAIRCACAINQSVLELGVEVRAGLHTGECELIDNKVAGIAVHTGARVAALAEPGEVLVSSTVKDLVAGSGLTFQDRGQHQLKGIPGEWRLYAVEH